MHMEIQKQMFGKQMFARPYRERGHREEFSKLTVLGFFLSTVPSICSTIVS